MNKGRKERSAPPRASRLQFTEEEWIRKQQAREDGTEATLPGIMVYFEDGEFKRHLTDEELAFL